MNKENAIELRRKLLNLPGKMEVVGQSDLPAIVFFRYTTKNLGDITGAGTGKDGKARARAARAVGVDEDEDVARAEHEADMVARSAWVAELLAAEKELGRALLLLAGGRGFLAGQGVALRGGGMAARAARYIADRRGRTPSDTSQEDAAAESGATNGRQAGQQAGGVSLALTAGQLASQRASLEAWAWGERTLEETTGTEARRALCSWIWRSLVPARKPGANEARARDCARQRARFLILLVYGESWADAAADAGYTDGGAASRALADAHTWAALGRAQAMDASAHPLAVQLRRQWARAARQEVKARRAARGAAASGPPDGWRGAGGRRGNVSPARRIHPRAVGFAQGARAGG
jgi:hypothetical protein